MAKIYTIVEFRDRVSLVPTKWLDKEKRICLWPMLQNPMQINDAVGSLMELNVDDNCVVLNVVDIICTASMLI